MKNILLFIETASKGTLESVQQYNKTHNTKYKCVVLSFSAEKKEKKKSRLVTHVHANLQRPKSIRRALQPYEHHIAAVISRGEGNVAKFKAAIPYVPYAQTPTETSLLWATDKLLMRKQIEAYDASVSPKFMVVKDESADTITQVKKKVGFPLVVKPTGLAQSLLVTICFHEDELKETLKKTFKKIRKVYKENKRTETPQVLVEQFMEGEMYSVDAYVGKTGNVYWCPLVHVKTGRSIGFDDFFGYQRLSPTTLKESTEQKALHVANQGIRALGLRSTTAHIELMRTEEGWKVIELGARIGGFRHKLHELTHGIDHNFNDVLIRLGKKPVIPKKRKTFAAALKFYAKEEGKLTLLKGVQKVKALESFKEVKVYLQKGDYCQYAKHGGKGVLDVVLANKDRSALLADIRRVEKTVKIETKKS